MNARFELYKIEHAGLAFNFKVNPSSCKNPEHYENYLKFIAINDKAEGRGTTHILLDNEHILGFITLRASSLMRDVDGKTYGDAALEIAEIAVCQTDERKGFGRLFVDLALSIASQLNNTALGIRYITLCADPSAVDFYKKLGFKPVADYGEIPREGWNDNCVPMFAKLPTQYH